MQGYKKVLWGLSVTGLMVVGCTSIAYGVEGAGVKDSSKQIQVIENVPTEISSQVITKEEVDWSEVEPIRGNGDVNTSTASISFYK